MTHNERVQVFILTDRWFFKVMSRAELEDQMNQIRLSAAESTSLGENAVAPAKGASLEAPKTISEPLGPSGVH